MDRGATCDDARVRHSVVTPLPRPAVAARRTILGAAAIVGSFQSTKQLRRVLLGRPHTVIVNVPYRREDEGDEVRLVALPPVDP